MNTAQASITAPAMSSKSPATVRLDVCNEGREFYPPEPTSADLSEPDTAQTGGIGNV